MASDADISPDEEDGVRTRGAGQPWTYAMKVKRRVSESNGSFIVFCVLGRWVQRGCCK